MGVLGQGFPLASYRPVEANRRAQFVKWTMTPAFDALSPAVAGIIECTKSDKAMFPFEVDTSIGSETWTWPEGPVSKQKLASYGRRNALCVFMHNETKRVLADTPALLVPGKA